VNDQKRHTYYVLRDTGNVSRHSYNRTVLFQNPSSGRSAEDARILVRQRLSAVVGQVEEVVVEPGVAVTERARQAVRDGVDLITVAGGDGTVREVATALVGNSLPLAIIPLGTFNNLALSLNIPRDIDGACQLLESGNLRQIDVGVADGRHYFFEAAGVGVDAELFPIGEEVKRGRFGALWSAVRLSLSRSQTSVRLSFQRPIHEAYRHSFRGQKPLKRRRRRFQKSLRTVKLRCWFVVACNGPYYGGNFAVYPGALLEDGLLSVGVFRDFSRLELLVHFWGISRGRYQYHPKLEIFEAAALEVSSRRRLFVHVDGQPIGTTPVRFGIIPRGLTIVAPLVEKVESGK
jgi:diacylglycerol kinase (ATP)